MGQDFLIIHAIYIAKIKLDRRTNVHKFCRKKVCSFAVLFLKLYNCVCFVENNICLDV